MTEEEEDKVTQATGAIPGIKEVTPTMSRSEKYISLYCNQVEIGFSAWDVQFSIMQVHGRTSDVIGEELASISMSPQHAKAMVLPLMNTIFQYEAQHGVVKIPGQKEPISLKDMFDHAFEMAHEQKMKDAEEKKDE
ncbi:MAG TPA: DUF3467 domain-containing protein [Pyrinomonadaceae bacterium]